MSRARSDVLAVTKNRADLGERELQDHPLGHVGRPQDHAFAGPEPIAISPRATRARFTFERLEGYSAVRRRRPAPHGRARARARRVRRSPMAISRKDGWHRPWRRIVPQIGAGHRGWPDYKIAGSYRPAISPYTDPL